MKSRRLVSTAGSPNDAGESTATQDAACRMPSEEVGYRNRAHRISRLVMAAARRFSEIDGAQRAAAISHYAFFALFPTIILVVAISAAFVDRERAAATIIDFVQSFIPIRGEQQEGIFRTLVGVVHARKQAGTIAFLLLLWSALRFFGILIRTANRAWGASTHAWWRLPLKSLFFLGATVAIVPLGLAIPVLINMARMRMFPLHDFNSWVYFVVGLTIPSVASFLSLCLFYKLAPRRHTRFREVWLGALTATCLLLIAQGVFGIYLKYFASLNAVYGTFGGVMALLLWIYLSGCIFAYGACLCAVRAEARPAVAETV